MKLTQKQEYIIKELGYEHPAAFLFHRPIRYNIYKNLPFEQWELGDKVVFQGELIQPFRHVRFAPKRAITYFKVEYNHEIIQSTIFNRPYLSSLQYQNGITVYGKYQGEGKVLVDKISPDYDGENIEPIYPSKAGIKQYEIRRLLKKLLGHINIFDVLPEEYREKNNLLSRIDALNEIHFPREEEKLLEAINSLKFEEFLMYFLQIEYRNNLQPKKRKIHSYTIDYSFLPFSLRRDQESVLKEIAFDISSNTPMKRLIQGDVGSGKTVVALLTAMTLIKESFQVAFLVPTEVLMYQHIDTVKKLFPNIKVLSLNQYSDSSTFDFLESGEPCLVIGTHSLFKEKTKFGNLRLVIIDEQHRFGVEQRNALVNKGDFVHLLMLSATPIPQTLAQTLFLDLDVSTLTYARENKVKTQLIKENSIRGILDDLLKKLEKGEQIYIVVPAVEKSERSGIRDIGTLDKNLAKIFSNYGMRTLHGQMNSNEKESIIKDFSKQKFQILLSTTVIEVGIDIPNANTIIIYNAEQFGLATLHQLRGRVGRGLKKGFCYILSDLRQEDSINRLLYFVEEYDGFKLSENDLKTRGMGDLLGTEQSGFQTFYMGDIQNDIQIIEKSRIEAQKLVQKMDNKDFKVLKKHVQALLDRKEG